MAITLGGEQRKGNIRVAYKRGTQVVEETYHWLVFTTANETREEILADPAIPMPGVSASPSGFGRCSNISLVRNEKNISIWELEANYSSNLEEDTGGSGGGDPTLWEPKYETILEPYTEYVVQDLDGRPITNGAGVPYAEGLPVEKDIIRWDFYQFEPASITDEEIADRNNTINMYPFMNRQKHTLLLKIRRSAVGFFYGYPCRLTEYSLLWKESNWHSKLPNVGQTFLFKPFDDVLVVPYRYIQNPEQVVTGPLGHKNYKIADLENIGDQYDFELDDNFAGAASPSSGPTFTSSFENAYASTPTEPVLYYIEYRNYRESDYSFLRNRAFV